MPCLLLLVERGAILRGVSLLAACWGREARVLKVVAHEALQCSPASVRSSDRGRCNQLLMAVV